MSGVLLCVDKDGTEIIADICKMERVDGERWLPEPYDWNDYGEPLRSDMWLSVPKGTIKKLIGRELTWDDTPVEWFGDEEKPQPKQFNAFDKVQVRGKDDVFYPAFYSHYCQELKRHILIGNLDCADEDIFYYEKDNKSKTTVINKNWKLPAGKFTTKDVITILGGSTYSVIAVNSWNYVLRDLYNDNAAISVDYCDDDDDEGTFVLKDGDEVYASDYGITGDYLDFSMWYHRTFNHITTMFEPKGGHIKTNHGIYKYVIPKKFFVIPSSAEPMETRQEKVRTMKRNIYTVSDDMVLKKYPI